MKRYSEMKAASKDLYSMDGNAEEDGNVISKSAEQYSSEQPAEPTKPSVDTMPARNSVQDETSASKKTPPPVAKKLPPPVAKKPPKTADDNAEAGVPLRQPKVRVRFGGLCCLDGSTPDHCATPLTERTDCGRFEAQADQYGSCS